MATNTILAGPPVIMKTYECSYKNTTVKGTKALTAANLGITDIPGYTIGAVSRWYSGSNNQCVAWFNGRTSGTVMTTKDETQTAMSSNATASIRLMWIRNDLIRDETVT